jgi:hypothetical protein
MLFRWARIIKVRTCVEFEVLAMCLGEGVPQGLVGVAEPFLELCDLCGKYEDDVVLGGGVRACGMQPGSTPGSRSS